MSVQACQSHVVVGKPKTASDFQESNSSPKDSDRSTFLCAQISSGMGTVAECLISENRAEFGG